MVGARPTTRLYCAEGKASRVMRRNSRVHRTGAAVICTSLVLIAFATAVVAQRGFGGGFGGRLPEGPGVPIRSPQKGFEDGHVAHCKLEYTSVRREASGVGWGTDYPYAGIHLLTRLGEMTKTAISPQPDGTPNYWVVTLTDPELFECPFLAASDIFVQQGALAGLSVDYKDLGRQAGEMVQRILKDGQPDGRLEAPAKVNLAVNRQTARQLGAVINEATVNSASKTY